MRRSHHAPGDARGHAIATERMHLLWELRLVNKAVVSLIIAVSAVCFSGAGCSVSVDTDDLDVDFDLDPDLDFDWSSSPSPVDHDDPLALALDEVVAAGPPGAV